MFPCIACHFPISLCQILHLATINVIIVTKVAGGNPIEFLLPEPSGTALFIFIQKQPLCRPSSQTVGVDLCIERFHHRHRGTARFFTYPRSGCSGFSEPDAWPEACGTRSESALYLRAGFLPLFPPLPRIRADSRIILRHPASSRPRQHLRSTPSPAFGQGLVGAYPPRLQSKSSIKTDPKRSSNYAHQRIRQARVCPGGEA